MNGSHNILSGKQHLTISFAHTRCDFCKQKKIHFRILFFFLIPAGARSNENLEHDSDEYHSAQSAIVSTDSGALATSNKLFDTNRILKNSNDSGGNQLTEKNREAERLDNSKQTAQHLNVLDTKNRCDTLYQANSSNGTQHRLHQTHQHQQHQHQQKPYHNRLGNATVWNKSHEQITHKISRRSARSSLENKAPLSSCCNHNRTNDEYYPSTNLKRGVCKRFQPSDISDSSDVNSEQNLVIENMRNRECEMYRKISFNNGYFDPTDSSSSGGYMYCSKTNANSIESTSNQSRCKKCLCKINNLMVKKSPKLTTKRKCRSFPLTENRHNQQKSEDCEQNLVKENHTQSARLSCARTLNGNGIQTRTSETATNTYQTNSRKITITIRTQNVAGEQQINVNQQQQQQPQHTQPNAIENYLTSSCETSEESDTSVSDYATLCSESGVDANVKQTHECDNANDFDVEPTNNESNTRNTSDDVDDDDDDDDSNSFFSLKSDIEYQSETSQYFNCASYIDLNAETMYYPAENNRVSSSSRKSNDFSNDNNDSCYAQSQSELKQVQTKMVKRAHTKNRKQSKNVALKASSSPMICIEQELCENRIITSKIEVDKEKIKEFKRRQKKRSQPKIIIDNTFSEEIFNETLNRSAEICCDKNVIDNIVSSLEAAKNSETSGKQMKNEQNIRNKFISDDFVFDKLQSSPTYTGKSIRRLLEHRIEQKSITSVRRTLLQNVAYAITEKEKQQKHEKKRSIELAPIKPPRCFTASSSSSPLSKQSFESSATIPISELNRQEQAIMGFVIPPSNYHGSPKYDQVGEESSIQFGWIRPSSNVDNNDPPSPRYVTADQLSGSTHDTVPAPIQNHGFCVPKEDIDTVDSSNRSTKDFERFSSILTENRQNNLSTPIKEFMRNDTQYESIKEVPVTKMVHTIDKPAETLCKNCHCKVKKEKHATLGKTGKRIGKAALKRTKTLIGTSKKLLKKQSLKEAPVKNDAKKENANVEVFSTPLKNGDNTVCNNRDTIAQEEYKKHVNKSLNLTPKEFNQNMVALKPSPKREVEISNIRLLKDAPNPMDDSEQYVTPDEAFDFDRVVNLPMAPEQEKTIKRSPSKMILKLAKSSKKLFQMKGRTQDKRPSDVDESTHYYKANDYDEFDNKVLLMGEMLSEMRKKIEDGQGSTSNIDEIASDRPLSAKKCLFRNRTVSTSSGDLLEQDSLIEQIATIDLHNEPEPEPLYAEIVPTRSPKGQDTLYHSCQPDDVNAISSCPSVSAAVPSETVQLKEVYINDRGDAQPSKYIMVNNNPKILYATVNRGSMQTRSLETIESRTEHSEDQVDGDSANRHSFQLSSSYESLDISLINDFATAVQTELDQCQSKMNEIFTTATSIEPDQTDGYDEVDAPKTDRKSNSGSESIVTTSDLNSGCSSFYRRNKNVVMNRPRKTLSEFVDTLSFDTVGTGSYCESLSRGNDLNSEIKDTITSLEYMPSEMGDSTDLSHDYVTNATFRSCATDINSSKDSAKVITFIYFYQIMFFIKS